MRSRSPSPRQFRRSVVASVNQILDETRNNGALTEEIISDLVFKAQIESNTISNEIKHHTKEIMERLPLAESELGSISLMVKNLSRRLLAVKSQLKTADERTERSVGFLENIDRIKSRIEHCAKLISEVQNWKYRLKMIDVLFGSRELERIASEIQEMEACVQMLANLPDYDRRLSELGELRTKLETMCSPHLLAAIQAGDYGSVKSLSGIFTKIDRSQTVAQIYLSSFADWLSQLDSKFQTDDRCSEIEQWLSNYYSEVVKKLEEEFQTISEHFPDVMAIDLVLHAVKAIKRKLDSWMEKFVLDNANAIDGIVLVLNVSKDFLIALSKLQCVTESHDSLRELLASFAAVFIPFSSRYFELESRKLSATASHLRRLIEINDNCQSTLSSVEKSSEILFDICGQALKRCQLFTQGLNVKSFQLATDTFISDFFERLLLSLRHIRKLAGHDSNDIASSESEWSSTSTAFRLVRFSKNLRVQLELFDAGCISSISHLLSPLTGEGDSGDVGLQFCRMLIPQQRASLEYLINFVESGVSGERNMLSQSRASACKFEKAIRTLAFDTMLRGIRDALRGFNTWQCWKQPDTEMPVFSAQPSDYITRIGDQLFGFVPELEARLDSEDSSSSQGDDMLIWLQQLSFAAVDDILSQIVSLPSLSNAGSKQLATDLEYLANILSALGIKSPSSLSTIQQSLLLSPQDMSSMQLDSRSDQNRILQIASIRQLSASTTPRNKNQHSS